MNRKLFVRITAIALAVILGLGVLVPVLYANAAPLQGAAAIPSTGDRIITWVLVVLIVAALVVAGGIVYSIVKKKKK